MISGTDIVTFKDLKTQISKLIKVIGVGGAGTNAVNYMFSKDPLDQVEYIVCNTDAQALKASPVPRKIQIGKSLTKGLGAGSNPSIGQQAAEEDMNEIRDMLSKNTKMVFITAGLGGGTGTGAAPEIAKLANELGLLTVAVVTKPFEYEGERRKKQAEKGLEKIKKYVDSLIVINNEKIIEVYGDLGWKEAFSKSDEVLSNAVRSVTKVITDNYEINVDFNDVEAVLKKSGTALIASAEAQGPNRAIEVVRKVLDSPLLEENHIQGAKDLLLLILSGEDQITVNEISRINKDLKKAAQNPQLNIIQGLGEVPSLGNKISVTIIATGFEQSGENREQTIEEDGKIIVVTSPEQPVVIDMPEQDFDEADENLATEQLTGEREQPETDNEQKEPVTATADSAPDDVEKEWTLFYNEQKNASPAMTNGDADPTQPGAKSHTASEEKEESPMASSAKVNPDPAETENDATLLSEPEWDHIEDQAEPVDNTEKTSVVQPGLFDNLEAAAEHGNENTGPKETASENATAENQNDPLPGNDREEKILIEEELTESAEDDMMHDLMLKRMQSDATASEPVTSGTASEPAEPSTMEKRLHRKENILEKQRLKKFMYKFQKNFAGPVIPGHNKPTQINLNSPRRPWDEDESYLNQKFD